MPRRSRSRLAGWLSATLDSKRMDLAGRRDGHVWVRLQTLRLLLDVWGALTRAWPHQAQNGWVEPHVVMLYPAATHLRPVNLVGTQPFFGAQGFQEKVCNKARAYLDCQTEHPCPPVPRLICLVLHDG